MNSVVLIGRLTKDCELKHVGPQNTPYTEATLAVNKPGKDAGADFIRVKIWNKYAESTCKYTSKGRQACT